MSAAVQLPTWAAYAVSLGTPALTFVGVLLAQWIGRRAAKELETRSKREETLRVLRWAAELAVSSEEGRAKLGVAELNALADSDLLDDSQLLFVDAALDAVIEVPEDEIEESEDDVDVRVIGPDIDDADEWPSPVPSEQERDQEGGSRG